MSANYRNGKGKKTIKFLNGNFDLDTPRDRDGRLPPKMVKKHQPTLNNEIEKKIIVFDGLGMNCKGIVAHLKEIYGLEILNGTSNAVPDKVIHTVKEWQARPLENVLVWNEN